MGRLTFQIVFLGMGLMAVTFSSCAKEPITSWDSPRMLAAKLEWDFLRRNPPPEVGGSKNDKLMEMQQSILRKTLSRDDMRRLAATCGTLPNEKDPNAFEVHVLQFMVGEFIEAGDREGLVTLLSNRFVEFVGPVASTQYYLLHCPTNALKDPILVFGEAYSRSKEPEAQRQIAQSVRRGFEGSGIVAKDDAEFVANAMRWYKENKSHLSPAQPGQRGDAYFVDDRTPAK